MRMIGLALVLVILLASFNVAAAEEPTGFAEFAWGTPRADLMSPCVTPGQSHPMPRGRSFEVPAHAPHVSALGDGIAQMSCGRSVRIGGSGWNPQLTLAHDRLAGYRISVRVGLYQELLAIAFEKFGPPTSTTTKSYRTRRGVEVIGQSTEWRWPSGTGAYLEELCGATDLSCLGVTTKLLSDLLLSTRSQDRERAKSGF